MSYFYQLVGDVTFSPLTIGDVVILSISLFLLLCSAMVSASEPAFFSLTPHDLEQIAAQTHRNDARVTELRDDSERLLATILIANNLVNVAIISLLDVFIMHTVHFGDSTLIEFLFTTVILTFILLLFGEIMPKIYSVRNKLSFCRLIAPVLALVKKLFTPISSLLMKSKVFARHLVKEQDSSLSVDELEQALELTDKKDLIEEQQMLQGIIRFGAEKASEVMTSRMDMVALDIHTSYEEVLQNIIENNYSRIPIYDETQDNIKGVLYIKDLLPHLGKSKSFRWQTLIRPPYFVPETKKIDDLLRDFQANKVHIAIVVDEFGGTSGLVTMEDIIEEIVGEINDEYDDDDSKSFVRLNQNTYVFEAKTLLTDFYRIIQLDDDFFDKVQGEADTLAGLLLEIKKEFPKAQEKITYRHITFEVLEMDERRIVKIKVIIGRPKA